MQVYTRRRNKSSLFFPVKNEQKWRKRHIPAFGPSQETQPGKTPNTRKAGAVSVRRPTTLPPSVAERLRRTGRVSFRVRPGGIPAPEASSMPAPSSGAARLQRRTPSPVERQVPRQPFRGFSVTTNQNVVFCARFCFRCLRNTIAGQRLDCRAQRRQERRDKERQTDFHGVFLCVFAS